MGGKNRVLDILYKHDMDSKKTKRTLYHGYTEAEIRLIADTIYGWGIDGL